MSFWTTIWSEICAWFMQYVATPFVNIGVRDVFDILLLTILIYEVYRFIRNRRAGRVMIGLLVVVSLGLLLQLFGLRAISYITALFGAAAFFCVVVIFQPEIRDALERIGNATFLNPGSDSIPRKHYGMAKSVADEVVDAVFKMSESKTGALIIFEGLTKLGDHIESGKIVDARVTSHLLRNIFYDKAPLHDGALVIRNMRIWSASCVLPSTKGNLNFGSMGTRHRAAVGVTEVSDALALMVSEETGIVSVAQDGKLLRGVDPDTLRDILMTYLAGRLYLRAKRGVYVDHFDGLPTLRKKVDEEPEQSTSAAEEADSDLLGTKKTAEANHTANVTGTNEPDSDQ